MHNIKTGAQLFSVRRAYKEAPLDTLKRVADLGYEGVEFFGSINGHDPHEISGWLKDANLCVCGWHTSIDSLQGDEFAKTVAFNKALGNTRVIVPALPERLRGSIAAWQRAADDISAIAERLKEHGMITGYHNHTEEFIAIDGVLPWDAFFGKASPEVRMQFDTGNAMHAGEHVDAAAILAAYPGRSDSIHLKPYKWGIEDGFATMMGEDSQPYADILRLCKADITSWFIVEFEHDEYCEPMEALGRCITALKKLGF